MPLVVIANRYGQLGNRLILFAHFIGNAIEHGYPLYNPGFHDYAHYFSGTCRNRFCRFPRNWNGHTSEAVSRCLDRLLTWSVRRKRQNRLVTLVDNTANDEADCVFDLTDPAFVATRQRSRIVLVNGWLFRDPVNIAKHSHRIREFFWPVEPYAANVAEIVGRARDGAETLIGVHIRRGDYLTFNEGKYHYEHDDC